MRVNREGYYDPVPHEAISNIGKESHKWRPLVYVCSAYSGDIKSNTEKARRYCRFAVDSGAIPIAPHLFLPQFMSDRTERELAMFMNKVFLGKCAELWVFGDKVTEGMAVEIKTAKQKRMTIRYFKETKND